MLRKPLKLKIWPENLTSSFQRITFLSQGRYHWFSVSGIFRISYMWYSFFGTILTILFGLVISWISDKIVSSRVLKLNQQNVGSASNPITVITGQIPRTESCGGQCSKNDVFTVESYRKKSQIHMNGFDNGGLKMDEA